MVAPERTGGTAFELTKADGFTYTPRAMNRVAFISDIDTSLGNELVRLYLEAGDRVFATSTGQEALSSFNEVAGESLKVSQWNRRSPVSARNMLLKAVNGFDAVDELILLGPPESQSTPLLQVGLGEIEDEIDTWLKGSLFLVREFLAYFYRRKSGSVALVAQAGGADASSLEESVRSGFRGLSRSLLREYGSTPETLTVNGFESPGSDPESYAAFVRRHMEEKARGASGRWFRHQTGILAGFRQGRR